MRIPRVRTVLLAPVALLLIAYVALTIRVATTDNTIPRRVAPPASIKSIAIFGASGTAGDGILEAAMANPAIEEIRVVTRRTTPRMQRGVASGKVEVTTHLDYLDYAAVEAQIADVDAIFWAIGVSSIGVDEDTYRSIHVDFPKHLVETWQRVSTRPDISFHFISSSDISEDSNAMWVRVKIESEKALFALADGTRLRVIAYRPDYIGPTDEEAHIGQVLLYWFFAPVGAAVRASQIGQAMMEVSARGDEFENGDKLGTWRIIGYSDAYEQRLGL